MTKQFVAPGVNPITFSADGRLFVGLAFYGDALWELDPQLQEPPQLVLEAPGQLNAFSFGPDGQLYSPSNTRRTLVRIDVDAKTLTPIGALNRSISAVKFDAAQRLWLHSEGDLLRVNRETGAIEQTIALGTMRADNFVPAAEDRFYVSGPGGLLEVTMGGTIRQIHPGGMHNPGGLAVVRDGDKEVLVVADLQSMYEFDAATGALLETHESNFIPPPGVSTLLGPMTVSASSAGVVVSTWIFPSAGHNVQEYDLGAETVLRQVIVTNTPINAMEFQGKLVVAEIASGSVAQFNGDERTVLASGLFVPAGLAASADALYVGDWASGLIFQLAAAGAPLNPHERIVTAGLKNPEGMALDASGNLLVVETGSRSLVRVNTTTGQIATVAAGLDLGPPLPAPGFPPTYMFDGVAVASSGAIYVTGYGANVIYRITEQPIAAPAQWVRIPTDLATTPAARAWHGMAYDSVRQVVLLHGGFAGRGMPALADTWSWDGQNWLRLAQQGPAALSFGFAFDSDRGVAVLHGGLGTGPFPRPTLGATWEWDGQTSNQVSLNTGPGLRAAPAMAYDPQRQRVLLHGGAWDHGGNTVFADTWEWDETAWVEIPDANGPARGLHAMAYDERHQVMVLFGGFDVLGSGPVDTWEFDGTQWRQAATAGPPGARALPILTYDPLRQAILLFGGGDYPPYGGPDYKYRNDVWEWNGRAWSEVPVEGTLPTPVIAAAGAYDPQRGRLVQFGGGTDLPNSGPKNETWEYGLMP